MAQHQAQHQQQQPQQEPHHRQPPAPSPEAQATCRIIRPREAEATYAGKQGLTYFAGVSAESAGAQRLCLHLLTIPPGGRARAHLHARHETAIYVLQGEGAMWYGPDLREHAVVRAGDFVYIPAGMPHLPYNPSAEVPCVAVVARTDPNEQESVVLLPELEAHAAADADR